MPPTVQDVAATANVSPATVSRVINNRHDVTPETVRVVEDAIRKVGYVRTATRRGRPSSTAAKKVQVPSGRQASSIALLIPVTDNESMRSRLTGQLVDGAEAMARNHNIQFHLARLSDDWHLPACLDPVQVDGLIVRSPGTNLMLPLPGIPTVWMFRCNHISVPGDRVQPDNELIGDMAANYLLNQGHQRLAVIAARPDHAEAQARTAQFTRVAAAGGAEVISIATSHMNEAAEQLLACSPRPTGLFMPIGDRYMEKLYRYIQQRGVRCGGRGAEIEIISCNNDATHLRLLDPTLANIDIRADEIGRVAAETLVWRLQNPSDYRRCIFIDPVLVPPPMYDPLP